MKKIIFYVVLIICICVSANAQYIVTNANDDGAGSLRQAIADAKTAPGIITFSDNFTITLLSELLVDANMVINGGSKTIVIDGNNATRVFSVTGNALAAEIRNITIQKGISAESGGGILNQGNLKLTKCTVTNCSASATAGGGGGIYNDQGVLTIDSCTISSNSGATGGGISSYSLATSLVLKITNSVIANNSGQQGGGFYNSGVAQITNTKIYINSATSNGGAIYNTSNNLTILNSCIYSNSSGADGGAIDNINAQLDITNSTVSGNTAAQSGGGIANGNLYNGGITNIKNCTISNNTADNNSTAAGNGGGIARIENIFSTPSAVNLSHTLIALNFDKSNTAPDVAGTVIGSDYNLIGTITGATGIGSAPDIISTTPNIGALADNGGGTFTHALLPGSPAIDAGNPLFDINGFSPALTYDQRESPFLRVVDGKNSGTAIIDIGAFEYSIATDVKTNPYVTNTTVVFPNPAQKCISITNKEASGKYILKLSNMEGKEFLSKIVEIIGTYTMDIDYLSNGIYFLTLENNGNKIVKKIVVQH
jgi:hypothetical protein